MRSKFKNMNRQQFFGIKKAFLVCSLLSFIQVSACRYTVREIGYTDLGDTNFHLYLIVNDDTEKGTLEGFLQVGYAMLLDSNVKVSIVNSDMDTTHPALKYITHKNRSRDLVEVLLVSPLGKSKLISKSESFEKDELWDLMEVLIDSEIRTKMTLDLAKSYGVLLLVEGENPIENARVHKAAKKAMEEIHSITALMAKPVDVPLRFYVLPYEKRTSEDLLLWSLGIYLEDKEPSLVTLFGRGRMMGAPLRGKEINAKETFKLLSIIGADCECGLERKWMLGTTVPLRWSKETQSVLSKELGFDVENPMIKSEMSQILSINLPIIEKISATTYVNSLERSKTMNKNEMNDETDSLNTSTNHIILYTLFAVLLIIGGAGTVLYLKTKNR